ncbi:antibiotic biosynthesis monooxygenase [Amycolatopsis suaedae]|uniref:ABM domain-containing protein n=1 Tax=Amycolatopsis suaedae TaxID=2510978 RepID=A0A4Q7J301_9PSEU|nr:antibiotic biosynthesis monooxygenase [Amycolatopsis suaedae]RZQ60966.1 hypothetical protein EWH70_26130 [Amycolatopsis suaedae]
MIARIWRASATADNAARYREHFTSAVLPELRTVDGFLDAVLLERDRGTDVEIQVITRWSSLDVIGSFAGADVTAANVAPDAVAVLTEFDSTVTHHTVTAESN